MRPAQSTVYLHGPQPQCQAQTGREPDTEVTGAEELSWGSVSPKGVTASASSGEPIKIQIPRPCLRPTKAVSGGAAGLGTCILDKLPR